MYDYNSISYEARERARRRMREAEQERLLRSIRTRARTERLTITAALRRLRPAGGL